jgi:hypothetical protein
MKTCPKCLALHAKPGVFCSRTCANSRSFSVESRQKKSVSAKAAWDSLPVEVQRAKSEVLANHSHRPVKNTAEASLTNLLARDWDSLGVQYKRLRVILEQDGKCNGCSISHWREQPITLEYEHKDGNNANNARDNVEALCPNCHSQTSTWRGRKNGVRQKKVDSLVGALGFEPRSSPNLGSREV